MPDALLHEWMSGLPANGDVVIVSLLGRKIAGKDEWSYYSFYNEGRSFQDWLAQHYREWGIKVLEHRTIDGEPISNEVLDRICSDVTACLKEGRTVVVMDSGGVCRVGQVFKRLMALPVDSWDIDHE